MTLGERLRAARERLGLSQEQVAQHLGVKQEAVSMWESGRRTPSRKNAERLCRLYRMRYEELFMAEEGVMPVAAMSEPETQERKTLPDPDSPVGTWAELEEYLRRKYGLEPQ